MQPQQKVSDCTVKKLVLYKMICFFPLFQASYHIYLLLLVSLSVIGHAYFLLQAISHYCSNTHVRCPNSANYLDKCKKLDSKNIRDSDYNIYKIEQNNEKGPIIVYY